MKELTTQVELQQTLKAARVVAVLGAHPDPSRPANYVPTYLREHGYRVLPVNAVYAGEELFGEKVRARLDEIGEPVDIVDVFRRSEALDSHLGEVLGMTPLPKVVWLQQGIRNDVFAHKLIAAGVDVVQDHCTKEVHSRMGRHSDN